MTLLVPGVTFGHLLLCLIPIAALVWVLRRKPSDEEVGP